MNAIFREEMGHLVGALLRILGNFAVAEEMAYLTLASLIFFYLSAFSQSRKRSLDRNMLYANGAFKLAHVEDPNGLTNLTNLANDRAC